MCIFLRFFVDFFNFFCTFFAFFASADRRSRYIRYRDKIGYSRYAESYNIGNNKYSSNFLSYCPINRFLESVTLLSDTASLCRRRLGNPPRDYCSLVDEALYQILAVMITTRRVSDSVEDVLRVWRGEPTESKESGLPASSGLQCKRLSNLFCP